MEDGNDLAGKVRIVLGEGGIMGGQVQWVRKKVGYRGIWRVGRNAGGWVEIRD